MEKKKKLLINHDQTKMQINLLHLLLANKSFCFFHTGFPVTSLTLFPVFAFLFSSLLLTTNKSSCASQTKSVLNPGITLTCKHAGMNSYYTLWGCMHRGCLSSACRVYATKLRACRCAHGASCLPHYDNNAITWTQADLWIHATHM